MKTYSVQDKYNNNKVWLIKVYSCGAVYYNQEISGRKVNSAFQRTTKTWVNEILNIDLNNMLSEQEQDELLNTQEPEEYLGADGTLHCFGNNREEELAFIKECKENLNLLEEEIF